jgi:hypothetical protein
MGGVSPRTALSFGQRDFNALLARLESSNEDIRWDAIAELNKLIHEAIQTDYRGIKAQSDAGLQGESTLDLSAGTRRELRELKKSPEPK